MTKHKRLEDVASRNRSKQPFDQALQVEDTGRVQKKKRTAPKSSAPGMTRTCDTRIRNPVLVREPCEASIGRLWTTEGHDNRISGLGL